MTPRESNRPVTLFLVLAAVSLASGSLAAQTSTAGKQDPLAGTVSIGDAVQLDNQAAPSATVSLGAGTSAGTGQNKGTRARQNKSTPGSNTQTNAAPVHLIYVHGINEIGPGDSSLLRTAICRYLKECIQKPMGPVLYANGPFGPDSAVPNLTYLNQPIWASKAEWTASTPFVQRYWISGSGHAPIVLDELNWYPLVYPLKCKFLLPNDERLAGSASNLDAACRPAVTSQGGGYDWQPDAAIVDNEVRAQQATLVNRQLKFNLMDWGFGDAVLALGPMQEILCAAIRQLLLQSLELPTVDPDGNPVLASKDDVQVFFVTHSLGSFLALAAIDSEWGGAKAPELSAFQMSDDQKTASDFFAAHTEGLYFLANQIALLELAHLTPCKKWEGDCAGVDAGSDTGSDTGSGQTSLSPSAATAHYAQRRQQYLDTHPSAKARQSHAQIIAWSAADDLLSWYVPKTPNLNAINLPARNSSFRIPGIIAGPGAVHGNYAKNKSIVKTILEPNKK
jgi:hypothetical protein